MKYFKTKNSKDEQLFWAVVLNIALTLGIMSYLVLFQDFENKTVYVSGEAPENRENILKGHICEAAFSSFSHGELSSDFIHPEIIKYLREEASYKSEDIRDVFTKMTSRDNCRVIFKREKGFSGLNVVITSNGPLGFRVTSLSDIKLKVEDVRSYL